MQPYTASPRDTLTVLQVLTLIRDAPSLSIASGCELVDQSLNVVADITDVFAGGSITRQSYATLHGSATLGIESTLDWGSAILRPYMTLSAGGVTARFNLGAYYTSTPTVTYGSSPVIHEVEGLDILDGLNSPIGEVYSAPAGSTYLSIVETILITQGYTKYVIDPARSTTVIPSARTWVLDENTTWLNVVNDLLSSIGYQGVWSDWDGRLRITQYATPVVRASEWTYDTSATASLLGPQRTVERDFYRAPNRWVFYRSNNTDGPAPVEGDGVYTVVNQTNGPTSIEARAGRVFTRPVPLDVADQDALVTAGQRVVDDDMRIKTKATAKTAPNPLHWHFDRLTLDDPDIGPDIDVLSTQWTLPLDGSDMSHEWSFL